MGDELPEILRRLEALESERSELAHLESRLHDCTSELHDFHTSVDLLRLEIGFSKSVSEAYGAGWSLETILNKVSNIVAQHDQVQVKAVGVQTERVMVDAGVQVEIIESRKDDNGQVKFDLKKEIQPLEVKPLRFVDMKTWTASQSSISFGHTGDTASTAGRVTRPVPGALKPNVAVGSPLSWATLSQVERISDGLEGSGAGSDNGKPTMKKPTSGTATLGNRTTQFLPGAHSQSVAFVTSQSPAAGDGNGKPFMKHSAPQTAGVGVHDVRATPLAPASPGMIPPSRQVASTETADAARSVTQGAGVTDVQIERHREKRVSGPQAIGQADSKSNATPVLTTQGRFVDTDAATGVSSNQTWAIRDRNDSDESDV